MRVNPDYAALEGAAAPSAADLATARATMDARLAAISPGLAADPGLLVEDRRAPGAAGGSPLGLRLYRPAGVARPSVLLWLHGGGFVMGGLDTDDAYCRRLAREAGCAVASLDYRLVPENPHPAAVEDVAATLAWLAAGGLGEVADARRLAVGGSSAGANLAIVAGLVALDRGGPALRLVLAASPPLDDRCETPSMLYSDRWPVMNRRQIGEVWGLYLGGRPATPYHAPARAGMLSGYPDLLITMGSAEPMLDEAWAFVRRLIEADVLAELHVLPGTPHGWERLEGSPVTRRGLALQAAALAAALA